MISEDSENQVLVSRQLRGCIAEKYHRYKRASCFIIIVAWTEIFNFEIYCSIGGRSPCESNTLTAHTLRGASAIREM
jgi:hypothetical protein